MLSIVAAFSGLYDLIVGAFLLLAPGQLASLFGVPPANPRIFSDLNAVFLLAVGRLRATVAGARAVRGYCGDGPLPEGSGSARVRARLRAARVAAVVPAVCRQRRRLALVTLVALLSNPRDRGSDERVGSTSGSFSRNWPFDGQ